MSKMRLAVPFYVDSTSFFVGDTENYLVKNFMTPFEIGRIYTDDEGRHCAGYGLFCLNDGKTAGHTSLTLVLTSQYTRPLRSLAKYMTEKLLKYRFGTGFSSRYLSSHLTSLRAQFVTRPSYHSAQELSWLFEINQWDNLLRVHHARDVYVSTDRNRTRNDPSGRAGYLVDKRTELTHWDECAKPRALLATDFSNYIWR